MLRTRAFVKLLGMENEEAKRSLIEKKMRSVRRGRSRSCNVAYAGLREAAWDGERRSKTIFDREEDVIGQA
jgi:hypothetical protein